MRTCSSTLMELTMASSGFMNRAWRVLGGKEAPAFDFELRLSFFQAMYFITCDNRRERQSFVDAAIIFASEIIRLEARKNIKMRPSKIITEFLDNKDNRDMFDVCFRSIDILNEKNPKSFDDEVGYRESYLMEINHYAYLTDIRMSVFDRTGKDRKTVARKILNEISKTRSKREKMDLRGDYTRRKAQKLKSKAAYICAATACNLNSLYSLSQKGIKFKDLLSMDIPEPDKFLEFYSITKIISDNLGLEMSPSMRGLAHTSNRKYKSFVPVSASMIDGRIEKTSAGRVTHKKPAVKDSAPC